MASYKLNRIVIKPTLACTADCDFCNSRRSLHKDLIKQKTVSLAHWETVLADARKLGAEYFVISGGEPTLYRNLIDLIKIGKKNNLVVTVNTNGFLLTENRVKALLEAGLDSVCISIHSHIGHVHNTMKCQEGVWERATEGVRLFARLGEKYPHFNLQTQAVICRENFNSFDELIAMHYNLGSKVMRFSYLEGDFEKKYLLGEKEIKHFKEKVMPKAIAFCETLGPELREEAEKVLKSLYREDRASLSDYAKGIYKPKGPHEPHCKVPQYQALILANGDVHPCNIVEYTHEPVMGNLFKDSLPEIWNSEKWNRFREDLFDKCALCPMNFHENMVMRKHRQGKKILPRFVSALNALPGMLKKMADPREFRKTAA